MHVSDRSLHLYGCLPDHTMRWPRVSEVAPASKQIRVYLSEIARSVQQRVQEPGID